MGNSEVGHLNLGAGRVVRMDITRIDTMHRHGRLLLAIPVLVEAIKQRAGADAPALARPGERWRRALAPAAPVRAAEARSQLGLTRVYVHAFLDGRDTLPTSVQATSTNCGSRCARSAWASSPVSAGATTRWIATCRWERELKTFDAMVKGNAEGGADPDAAAQVREGYNNGVTDEFTMPFVCTDDSGRPVAPWGMKTLCICFNYRADRVRQITRVLARNVEGGLTKLTARPAQGRRARP